LPTLTGKGGDIKQGAGGGGTGDGVEAKAVSVVDVSCEMHSPSKVK